ELPQRHQRVRHLVVDQPRRRTRGHPLHHRASRTTRRRVAQERVRVETFAAQRHEQRARLQRPRVRFQPAVRNVPRLGTGESQRGAHASIRPPALHAVTSPPLATSACTISRSSNGRFSVPTIWYVSCPLPASNTTSSAFASDSASAIARRRSASRT